MQLNTTPTPHPTDPPDRPPIPAELLETVARALAAALVPRPRQPEPAAAQEPDFLTAAQLAARLGVSGRRCGGSRSPGRCRTPWCAAAPVRRPAGSRGGSLTSSRPAAWTRTAWPPSPTPGGRGSPLPHGDGCRAASPHPRCPGAFCRALAGAGCVPRRAHRGVLSRPRRDGRARAAGLRAVPGPPAVPGVRRQQPDRLRDLGRAHRTGTPRAAIRPAAGRAAGPGLGDAGRRRGRVHGGGDRPLVRPVSHDGDADRAQGDKRPRGT